MNDLDLHARMEALENENRRLAQQIEGLLRKPAEEPASDSVPRRGLLRRVGTVALGATALGTAGPLVSAPSAAAADGDPLLVGRVTNSATDRTEFSASLADKAALAVFNLSAGGFRNGRAIAGAGKDVGLVGYGDTRAGVIGVSPNGSASVFDIDRAGVGGVGSGVPGVRGVSDSTGVHGTCKSDNGVGVLGDGAAGAVGVSGVSGHNHGVRGVATIGRGVVGQSLGPQGTGVVGIAVQQSGNPYYPAAVTGDSRDFAGVQGVSASSDGVWGHSTSGRGGVFSGGAAALRLRPGSSENPPTRGETGDLYVGSNGRLWYCRQGGTTANWVGLA